MKQKLTAIAAKSVTASAWGANGSLNTSKVLVSSEASNAQPLSTAMSSSRQSEATLGTLALGCIDLGICQSRQPRCTFCNYRHTSSL